TEELRSSGTHSGLSTQDSGLPLSDVYRLTGANRQILRGLEEKGLVEVFGAPRRSEPASLRPGRYEPPPPRTLEQARAWEPLAAALARGALARCLLPAAPASGK